MIRTVAVQGYRSLRELVLPLGQLSVITGANGSGKSSVYRSLRLLADVAQNAVVASLAREGGLPSTFWAGPETIARSVRQGTHAVEGLAKRNVASLKLGFGSDTYGYSIDLGYPPPPPPATMFELDPRVKRECVWHGPVYRKASALVDRRNSFVWLSTTRDEEPVFLTQHLADTDSMLASVADPQRAPEMLAVREAVRGWRFYDQFHTDSESPARAAQIGTWTPVLHHDGSNLAAALQTILEIRSDEALATTLEDAFPGSRLYVEDRNGRFDLQLKQHGLLRPLSAAELSDGTLRYLLWTAALLTPRPPELMVLNEPETSLHPDLLPALARLILAAAADTQIIVVSHAQKLIEILTAAPAVYAAASSEGLWGDHPRRNITIQQVQMGVACSIAFPTFISSFVGFTDYRLVVHTGNNYRVTTGPPAIPNVHYPLQGFRSVFMRKTVGLYAWTVGVYA